MSAADSTIYLDYAATSPLAPGVIEAMQQALVATDANPASPHGPGRAAAGLIDTAAEEVAGLINTQARNLVWTSGATESINLALKGMAGFVGAGTHIVSVVTEHSATLDTLDWLEKQGVRVTRLAVQGDGRIDLDALEAALEDDATLVSIMHVNNETGAIQDIAAVGERCSAHGVPLHVDAAQSLGRLPIDVQAMNIALLSLSAHKIGGPTGVGALLVRPGRAITSLLRGGGQEQGRRSGTENVIGIAGFGGAAQAAFNNIAHYRRMAAWRDQMESQILRQRDDVTLFGAGAGRIGNTCCLALGERSSETMVMALDLAGVAVSAGSACSSGKVYESHVLKAMGAGQNAGRAIRISGGWNSAEADFEKLAEVLVAL